MEQHNNPMTLQAFVRYQEQLVAMHGQTVPMETHCIILSSLTRAISLSDSMEHGDLLASESIVALVAADIERLLAYGPTMEHPDRLRQEVEYIRQTIAGLRNLSP